MVSSCAGAARSHAAGLPDHTARRLRCPWLRCRLAVNRDIPHHGRLGRAERLLTTDCQDGHGQPGPLEDPVVLNILRQGGEHREPGFPSSRARRQDQAARPFAIDYPAHLTQHLGPPASDARRLALRARGAGPCGRTLRPEQSAEPVYLWVDSVYPLAASPPELLRGGLDARRELGPEASPLPRVRNCEWLSGD
jgi:hypothetical protein